MMPSETRGDSPGKDGSIRLSAAEKSLLDKSPDSDRHVRLKQLQQLLADSESKNNSNALISPEAATTALEIAGLSLDLDDKETAYRHAREIVTAFIACRQFENAALACQYVYLCDKPDAIPAIGQSAWLAVTYPVDPHLTANVLDLIIDETPDDSDGAAVAAATAHYVVDMRCTDSQRDELKLFTGAMLARVAKRHSQVETQEKFDRWVKILELDDPEKFLVRLRNVIDVMVQEEWWFDREQLRENLPND